MKENIQTIKLEGAETLLDDLERVIDECLQCAIRTLADVEGITIEEATQIADEISKNAPDLILPNLPFQIEY
jgi:hypothetical protein